jgi:hypothetical protein
VGDDDSCCFLREPDDARGPGQAYTGRGNADAAALFAADLEAAPGAGARYGGGHASFATPLYWNEKEAPRRPQMTDAATEMMAVGNGFGMVAGDCCFICTFANRYCHNTCSPRKAHTGASCGKGSFGGDGVVGGPGYSTRRRN